MPSLYEAPAAAVTACHAMMFVFSVPLVVFLVVAIVYVRATPATATAMATKTKVTAVREEDDAHEDARPATERPPLFLLVGDSTTAVQTVDGGGWGTGFLSFLARGARGVNYGVNGATTRSCIESGLWDEVVQVVRRRATHARVFVTIQFGHNDQLPSRGVTLAEYQAFLVQMARDVLAAGGTPILLTPLARRDFDQQGRVVDNLHAHRLATLAAAEEVTEEVSTTDSHPRCFDLNQASLAYVGALGRQATLQYNLRPLDTTHLNEHGSVVFGRMVADLLLGHPARLVASGERDKWAPGTGNDDDGRSSWIRPSPLLTGLIWHGKPA